MRDIVCFFLLYWPLVKKKYFSWKWGFTGFGKSLDATENEIESLDGPQSAASKKAVVMLNRQKRQTSNAKRLGGNLASAGGLFGKISVVYSKYNEKTQW